MKKEAKKTPGAKRPVTPEALAEARLTLLAQRMDRLVRAGATDSDTLLFADFGTRFLKGLDTAPLNDPVPVVFRESKPKYLDGHGLYKKAQRWAFNQRVGGWIEAGDTDHINFPIGTMERSRRLGTKWYAAITGHEHIHIRQFREYGVKDLCSVLGNIYISPIFNHAAQGKTIGPRLRQAFRRAAYNMLATFGGPGALKSFGKLLGMTAASLFVTSRLIENSSSSTRIAIPFTVSLLLSGLVLRHMALLALKPLTISNYFLKDVEAQTRIHELMSEGYATWRRMPATKMELWAALHNAGVRTPPSVLAELQKSDEGLAALEKFIKPYAWIRHRMAVMDMNFLQGYAGDPDAWEKTWRLAFPGLYGSLLELYGDSKGRARMGMGTNPQAAIRLLRAVKNAEAPEHIRELAAAVGADQALNAANLLIRCVKSKDNPPLALGALKALLERPETREAILRPQSVERYGNIDPSPDLTLITAWWADNEKAEALLYEAGVDPYHPLVITDAMTGETLTHRAGRYFEKRKTSLFNPAPV